MTWIFAVTTGIVIAITEATLTKVAESATATVEPSTRSSTTSALISTLSPFETSTECSTISRAISVTVAVALLILMLGYIGVCDRSSIFGSFIGQDFDTRVEVGAGHGTNLIAD